MPKTSEYQSQAASFPIATLQLEGRGRIGVCPLPGKHNALETDLAIALDWDPTLVLSMTELSEMEAVGSASLGDQLRQLGIDWFHLPVRDFAGLGRAEAKAWPELASAIHDNLDAGKGVLIHCRGGQGRTGMIALRLLVERGEEPDAALKRLRTARPGAVETDEQCTWALRSSSSTA